VNKFSQHILGISVLIHILLPLLASCGRVFHSREAVDVSRHAVRRFSPPVQIAATIRWKFFGDTIVRSDFGNAIKDHIFQYYTRTF
jgi:hypothetical protein